MKNRGRPITEEPNRVSFSCLVKPSTKALLKVWGDLPKMSGGLVIDELVEERKAKLDYDSEG